jgi:hypothetical protein
LSKGSNEAHIKINNRMKNYSIPVNGEQAKAYELVALAKQNIATSSSKEEMRKVAEEFGSLGLTKWQALSLCFNYYQKDKVIPVAEKMSIFKEGVLNPKRNENCSEVLKTKEAKPFWEIDTKKGRRNIILETSDIVGLLTELGYYKFNKSKTGNVKLEGKILSEVDASDMQESVKSYLCKIDPRKLKKVKSHKEVWEFIINKKHLFNGTTLSYLPVLKESFHRDKKDEINLYLNYGYLLITSERIQYKSYVEMDGVVWKESIVKAPFSALNYSVSEYEIFLGNTQDNDKKRMDNTMKVIGHLMHRYNFHSNMKIACFTDELISMDANGGTGKNLTLELLAFIRSMVTINGKGLNLRNRFALMRVEDYHDIVLLNDIRKDLDLEDLYSHTTEGIETEQKNENSKSKNKTTTGKFAITANYRKLITSGSTRRRVVDVFYSNHYNYTHSVADEFNKEFFVDFNEEEWNQTITFAIRSAQLYLKEGLPENKSIEEESLELNTSREFVEFMDVIVSKEVKINRSGLNVRFKKKTGFKIGDKEFCKWAERYFKVKSIITKGFMNSNGKTYANKSGSYFYEIVANN